MTKIKMIHDYSIGDIISFTYKGGRKVTGEVLAIYSKPRLITLKLHTDYISNEEWYVGEEKNFYKAEMKTIAYDTDISS